MVEDWDFDGICPYCQAPTRFSRNTTNNTSKSFLIFYPDCCNKAVVYRDEPASTWANCGGVGWGTMFSTEPDWPDPRASNPAQTMPCYSCGRPVWMNFVKDLSMEGEIPHSCRCVCDHSNTPGWCGCSLHGIVGEGCPGSHIAPKDDRVQKVKDLISALQADGA